MLRLDRNLGIFVLCSGAEGGMERVVSCQDVGFFFFFAGEGPAQTSPKRGSTRGVCVCECVGVSLQNMHVYMLMMID